MAGKKPRNTKDDTVQLTTARPMGVGGNSDFISIALKKLHDDVQAEDVPKEFLDILAEIDLKIGSTEDSKH